jgi:hypothetical protein
MASLIKIVVPRRVPCNCYRFSGKPYHRFKLFTRELRVLRHVSSHSRQHRRNAPRMTREKTLAQALQPMQGNVL